MIVILLPLGSTAAAPWNSAFEKNLSQTRCYESVQNCSLFLEGKWWFQIGKDARGIVVGSLCEPFTRASQDEHSCSDEWTVEC
jgi:hypothetical protein